MPEKTLIARHEYEIITSSDSNNNNHESLGAYYFLLFNLIQVLTEQWMLRFLFRTGARIQQDLKFIIHSILTEITF